MLPPSSPSPQPAPSASLSKFSLELATVTHGRGLHCDTLRQVCLKNCGPEGWDEVLGRLSPPAREVFQDTLGNFAWVPIAFVNELEVAFSQMKQEGRPFYQGQAIADEQLKVAHPWLMKLLNPEALVQQAGTLFRFYYKGGVLEIDEVSKGHGLASIWALGMPEGWYVSGIPGWFTHALRLAGAQRVDIQHEGPPVGSDPWRHRYSMLWE